MNQYDIALYEYAKSLVAMRVKDMTTIIDRALKPTRPNREAGQHCKAVTGEFVAKNKKNFGVFQPPGHKGPN